MRHYKPFLSLPPVFKAQTSGIYTNAQTCAVIHLQGLQSGSSSID